ncbi:MAG: hypothetical protein DBX44_08255 [Oscillospiraceae bacterium]|nr:MAG: hypothetical protein DBX44_08255 [Oscillospiraceae bacterium]
MRKISIAMLLCALLVAMLCSCGDAAVSVQDSLEQIEGAEWTLSDGTQVSLWRWREFPTSDDLYCLPDRTVLLTLSPCVMPYLEGLEPTVRAAIERYYEEQGPLYDLGQELENALEEYRSCQEKGKAYSGRYLGQEILLCGENERIVCCMSLLHRPLHGRIGTETRRMTVLDRETGETVDPRTLFQVPEQELICRLIELSGLDNPPLSDAMREAFHADMVLLSSAYLEAEFPLGSLPGQDTPYILVVDDEEAMKTLMQPWAILQQDGEEPE